MASKILDLVIKVTDQASKQLDEIRGTASGEGKGVEGLGTSMVAFAGKATLALMALQKVARFIDESVGEYTEYALQIDNLAAAFGLTTEEAEELILVADAMGVSNDALFSSMNKLAREGFGTGIEALAGLREAFLAIEDPAAGAEYLFGMVGEQGQKVLGPLLTMSDLDFQNFIDGMNQASFLTDDMTDQARDLDLAMNAIDNSWNRLKISLLSFSAPGLTNLLNQIAMIMGGDFSRPEGPTGYERSTGRQQIAFEDTPSGYERMTGNTELIDTLRNLPNDIRDAVERSGDGLR